MHHRVFFPTIRDKIADGYKVKRTSSGKGNESQHF